MKKLAITILVLTTAISAFAQTRTVTNQELEKFRQQRLQSERDLKAKYAEMGTTAEEVERQRRERRAELEEYSDQLRVWRIMAENQRIEQENARREYERLDDPPALVYYYGVSTPYIGYFPYGYYRRNPLGANLRNLPPNMRIAREYGLTQWNSGPVFNPPTRVFRPRPRAFTPNPRPRVSIRFGLGGRGF